VPVPVDLLPVVLELAWRSCPAHLALPAIRISWLSLWPGLLLMASRRVRPTRRPGLHVHGLSSQVNTYPGGPGGQFCAKW